MESSMRVNKLYNASINGDINLLNQLLEEDKYALEDYGSSVGFCLNGTPLHIAASRGHVEFADVLLHHKPQLVGELDSRSRTPLHLAVSNGSVKMVQLLLKHERREDNNVCLMTDEFGRTPLRLAIMTNAESEVVKDLAISEPKAIADLLTSTKSVRILHSYALSNGVDALSIFASVDSFLCSQDEEGNTIFHRAISLRKEEILEYLIQNDGYLIGVNLTNRNNLTVLDLIHQMPTALKTNSMHKYLTKHSANIDTEKKKWYANVVDIEKKNWYDNKKETLIVVATLIAGMAYQGGLSPPGGVWDEDKPDVSVTWNRNTTAIAGTSIMSLKDKTSYDVFWIFNSISFIGALAIILLLMHGSPRGSIRVVYMSLLTFILWLTATSMIVAYVFAWIGTTTNKLLSGVPGNAIVIGFVWIGLILIVSIIKGYQFTRVFKKTVNAYNRRRQGNNDGTTTRSCALV